MDRTFWTNEVFLACVATFLAVDDFLRLRQLCRASDTAVRESSGLIDRFLRGSVKPACVISHSGICTAHFLSLEFSRLHEVLAELLQSSVFIQDITYVSLSCNVCMYRLDSIDELEDLRILLERVHLYVKFSSHRIMLAKFSFPAPASTFSTPIDVPGGTVRLIRRSLHDSNADNLVLGLHLECSDIWLVRIVAVTGTNRFELMAGTTKADPLRVSNSTRGTWSDLMPIDAQFYCPIMLIEYILKY